MWRSWHPKHETPLYPPIEPYDSGTLKVSSIHTIYYEQCGNPKGLPVLFVHGGPGEEGEPNDRRYFDPEAYRIILFDQRGCGKSTPTYCLEENDTWLLVQDMEKLCEHLGVKKWVVFGGWGSTLSLVYAEKHIERVLGLVLWGIFMLRKEELAWYNELGGGASFLFPDAWREYLSPIPEAERGSLVKAYYKRFTGDNVDEEERNKCVKGWVTWETATYELHMDPEELLEVKADADALGYCCMESHYLVNGGFLPTPNYILDNAGVIAKAGIPVTIVQGRYDVICPPKEAWDLHNALPKSELHFVWNAGHEPTPTEPAIAKKLVGACDKYKTLHLND